LLNPVLRQGETLLFGNLPKTLTGFHKSYGANQRDAMQVTAMQIRMAHIHVKSWQWSQGDTQCKWDATSPTSHNYGGVDLSPNV